MRLARYDDGAGAPIVLVHAGIADHRQWDPQVPALVAAGFRVIRVDLPGFGATPAATGPYDRGGVLLDALADLGAGPAVVVGSSYGGLFTQAAALAAPGRVRALMLVCAAFTGRDDDEPELIELERREDELVAAGDLAAAARINADAWIGPDGGPDAHAAIMEQFQDALTVQANTEGAVGVPVPDIDVAEIGVPSLVVSGGHDFASITAAAGAAAVRMPAARHLHLPWAGHLPNLERPDDFTALLIAFAAGAAAGAAAGTTTAAG